jgi:hypothetical protein
MRASTPDQGEDHAASRSSPIKDGEEFGNGLEPSGDTASEVVYLGEV